MGEHMSNCSINNIARVIDVTSRINVDSFHVSNEPVSQLMRCRKEAATNVSNVSVRGSGNTLAVGNESKTADALMVLLASFLTQLMSFMSGAKPKAKPIQFIPAPPVTPKVMPQPESLAQKPKPSTNIPGLSSKRDGAKPENIWDGFRQGPDGNCVTVSAIKAAMFRFGQSPTDIYQHVTKLHDGYRVVMRDGFQLTLTDRELVVGAAGARFRGTDEGTIKDAQFLYAVSAKRAQMENNDGMAGRSYQAAIGSLNNGEDESGPGEAFLRLGLRQHMKKVHPRDLARGQVGMCNRNGHSVAVLNGREDKWGRPGAAPTRGDAVALV